MRRHSVEYDQALQALRRNHPDEFATILAGARSRPLFDIWTLEEVKEALAQGRPFSVVVK